MCFRFRPFLFRICLHRNGISHPAEVSYLLSSALCLLSSVLRPPSSVFSLPPSVCSLLSMVCCPGSVVRRLWCLYICRESSTNRPHFMQNKPNFPDDQMYVTVFYTKEYENRPNCKLDGNKANTKPNKPNFRKDQMNVTLFTTNAYGNEPRTTNNEHSCKTNPIKANSRPVLSHQVCKTARIHWRRRESNPHFRDATAACSRYTTSPISSILALLYRPLSTLQNRF